MHRYGGAPMELRSQGIGQYSAGLAHQINQNWGFSIGAGQMVGVKGNFKPIFTDIGIIYKFATIQNR